MFHLLLLLVRAHGILGQHGQCPMRSRPEVPDNTVDCGDIISSLDGLSNFLTAGTKPTFGGTVIVQGTSEWDEARMQYASATFPTMPSYIVEALNEIDVQATILHSSNCGYKVNTRSGGHSYLGISSCDSAKGPCIQLDVRAINHVNVKTDKMKKKEVNVGPGILLGELSPALVDEGVFVPGGECSSVGIGGHMQTGGFGNFARSLGAMAHHVKSFKIILADGSLQSVVKPSVSSDKLNDDLYYAVVGGASGSFGVIVDVTFDPVDDNDYAAFYWEVHFLWDDSTLPSIKKMLRKYADLVASHEDNRNWNLMWSVLGLKTLHTKRGLPPFNLVQIDFVWVYNKCSGCNDEALAEARTFFNSIVNECPNCLLDDYFDKTYPPSVAAQLKSAFPQTYEKTGPLAELHGVIAVSDFDRLGAGAYPYHATWQQGPDLPSADDIEGLIERLDAILPKNPESDLRFVISQFGNNAPVESFHNPLIALPHQSDKFGVDLDQWDLTGGTSMDLIRKSARDFQDYVISIIGGVDHLMFWNPGTDPDLESGQFYESEQKYQRLVAIKSCVDPGDVFKSRMSIPPNSKRGKADKSSKTNK